MNPDPVKLMEAVGCLLGGHAAIEALSSDPEARDEAKRALDNALALAPMFADHVQKARAAMAITKANVEAAIAKAAGAPVEPAAAQPPIEPPIGAGG